MNGAELGKAEFGYLLAAVGAKQLVGVDAPGLFPKDRKKREALYRQGREDLEASGWLVPVRGRENEYDLDPVLYELVATVAWPEYLLATIRQGRGQAGLALHYLAGINVVELAVMEGDRFKIGVVPDQDALWQRLAQMMDLSNIKPGVHGRMNRASFKKLITAAAKGREDQAQALLDEADGNAAKAGSLITAASGAAQGHMVLISIRDGRPGDGRRATFLGKGKAAWIVYSAGANGKTVALVNANPDSLTSLLADWLNDFAE
jgi:hypothetical protein